MSLTAPATSTETGFKNIETLSATSTSKRTRASTRLDFTRIQITPPRVLGVKEHENYVRGLLLNSTSSVDPFFNVKLPARVNLTVSKPRQSSNTQSEPASVTAIRRKPGRPAKLASTEGQFQQPQQLQSPKRRRLNNNLFGSSSADSSPAKNNKAGGGGRKVKKVLQTAVVLPSPSEKLTLAYQANDTDTDTNEVISSSSAYNQEFVNGDVIIPNHVWLPTDLKHGHKLTMDGWSIDTLKHLDIFNEVELKMIESFSIGPHFDRFKTDSSEYQEFFKNIFKEFDINPSSMIDSFSPVVSDTDEGNYISL